MIYHIASRADWAQSQQHPHYTTDSLKTEGFIHCSTREQVLSTANNFFQGRQNLVLLYILEEGLPLRYEAPIHTDDPGVGQSFPHVYGPIPRKSVEQVLPLLPNAQGQFTQFPSP